MRRTLPGTGLLVGVVIAVAGCDSLGDAALQTGEAGVRTLVDILLTEWTNQLADALVDGPDGGSEDVGDSDIDDGDDMGGDDDMMTDDDMMIDGAVIRGEMLVSDNCAACHGADGASGFAPDIQGLSQDRISESIAGEAGHVMVDLSEQEIGELAAFLESL